MEKFGFATLIASGLTAAVLGFAPIASADVTVHQSPGNAQVSATPGGAQTVMRMVYGIDVRHVLPKLMCPH